MAEKKEKWRDRVGKGKAEVGTQRGCVVFALSCIYKSISLCLFLNLPLSSRVGGEGGVQQSGDPS